MEWIYDMMYGSWPKLKVGQVCGADASVKIRIEELGRAFVRATVIEVNGFWAHRYTPTDPDRSFEVGMELVFERIRKRGLLWTIDEPKRLPWFTLHESGRFEHYR